jgi:hypothetical protein
MALPTLQEAGDKASSGISIGLLAATMAATGGKSPLAMGAAGLAGKGIGAGIGALTGGRKPGPEGTTEAVDELAENVEQVNVNVTDPKKGIFTEIKDVLLDIADILGGKKKDGGSPAKTGMAKLAAREKELEAQRAAKSGVEKAGPGPSLKDPKSMLGALALAALAFVQGFIGGFIRSTKSILNSIAAFFKADVLWAKMLPIFKGMKANVLLAFTSVLESVKLWGAGLKESKFGIAIAESLTAIKTSVKTFFTSISTTAKAFATGMKESAFGTAIAELITSAKTSITTGITAVKTALAESGIGKYFIQIGTDIKSLAAPLEKLFAPLKSFFAVGEESKGLTSILAKIVKPFKTAMAWGKTIATEVGAWAKTFSKVTAWFKTFGAVLGKLAWPLTIVMGIWDSVTGFIDGYEKGGASEGIKQGLIKLLQGLIALPLDLVKSLVSWIAGKMGFEEAEKSLDSFSFADLMDDMVTGFFRFVEDMIFGIVEMIKTFDPSDFITGDSFLAKKSREFFGKNKEDKAHDEKVFEVARQRIDAKRAKEDKAKGVVRASVKAAKIAESEAATSSTPEGSLLPKMSTASAQMAPNATAQGKTINQTSNDNRAAASSAAANVIVSAPVSSKSSTVAAQTSNYTMTNTTIDSGESSIGRVNHHKW